jgi:hypothetical protein
VSSSFAFHFVCVRFGFNAAPAHHNHSLTTGLIFRGRLNPQTPPPASPTPPQSPL